MSRYPFVASFAQTPGRVIIIFATLALLPAFILLIRGIPLSDVNSGHDSDFAIRMQILFSQELKNGHWPVRWLAEDYAGFGSAGFYLYGQAAFLPGTLWQALGASPDTALAITILLARSAAFIGALLWLQQLLRDTRLASLGAALFLLSPYVALTQPIQRGAFAETVAVAFVPYLFLAIDSARGTLSRTLLSSLMFAGLACTHIVSTMLVAIVVVGYATLCHGWRRAGDLFMAGGLGAAIAAIGLVPALLLQDWLSPDWQFAFYRSPPFNLLFSPLYREHFRGVFNGLLVMNYATWGLCLLAFLLLASHWRKLMRSQRGLALTLVAIIIAMTWVSVPMWQVVPFLSKAQFPTRLLTVAALLAAAALTMCAAWTQPWLTRCLAVLVVALLFGETTVAIAQDLQIEFLRRHGWLLPHFAPSSAERLAAAAKSLDTPEYAPRLANDLGWPLGHPVVAPAYEPGRTYEQDANDQRDNRAALTRFGEPALVQGRVTALHVQKVAGRWEYSGEVEEAGATVRLPLLYWPLFEVEGARLLPDTTTGLTLLHLPPGSVRGIIQLQWSWAEILGTGITTIAWGGWFIGLYVLLRQRRTADVLQGAERHR